MKICHNYKNISDILLKKYYYITKLKKINTKINVLMTVYSYQFRDSWNRLNMDLYMSNNEKYRYRRYSVVNYQNACGFEYLPPEPHFQMKTYNTLNGDIDRYYSPFEKKIITGLFLKEILNFLLVIFNKSGIEARKWRIECHQFRIVPTVKEEGLPTPEGKHRDGVDYVFMMLIKRYNVDGGVTYLYSKEGKLIDSYTMKEPYECILIDDKMTMHEVSAVRKVDDAKDAYRDMLVLTFRRV